MSKFLELSYKIIASSYFTFCIFLLPSLLKLNISFDLGIFNFIFWPTLPFFFIYYVLIISLKYAIICFAAATVLLTSLSIPKKYKWLFLSINTASLISFGIFCFTPDWNAKKSAILDTRYAYFNIILYFAVLPILGVVLAWLFKKKNVSNSDL
jgi:hypothetical protein